MKAERCPRLGTRLLTALLAALLAGLCLFSLSVGASSLSPAQSLAALLGRGEDTARRIVLYVRLPRLLGALLAGSALALAGVLLQRVLLNPLAAPSVIGVNAGAGLFALCAMAFFPAHPGLTPLAAFAGALVSALTVYALAQLTGASRSSIVLAGVAVSSLLGAVMDAIVTLIPDAAGARSAFSIGGFESVTLDQLRFALPLCSAGAVLAWLLRRESGILALGDETARGLGVRVGAVRLALVAAAALLAGGAVSFAGLLGFVGLITPHAARAMVRGEDGIMPLSMVLGALLTTLCDLIARTLFAPYELPVGVVLAFLGAPFFLYLLFRGKRSNRHDGT